MSRSQSPERWRRLSAAHVHRARNARGQGGVDGQDRQLGRRRLRPGHQPARSVTASDGSYQIANVPLGMQTLQASANGFLAKTATATVQYNASTTVPTLTLVVAPPVTATATVRGVALLFDQTSSAGTTVTVVGSDSAEGQSPPPMAATRSSRCPSGPCRCTSATVSTRRRSTE